MAIDPEMYYHDDVTYLPWRAMWQGLASQSPVLRCYCFVYFGFRKLVGWPFSPFHASRPPSQLARVLPEQIEPEMLERLLLVVREFEACGFRFLYYSASQAIGCKVEYAAALIHGSGTIVAGVQTLSFVVEGLPRRDGTSFHCSSLLRDGTQVHSAAGEFPSFYQLFAPPRYEMIALPPSTPVVALVNLHEQRIAGRGVVALDEAALNEMAFRDARDVFNHVVHKRLLRPTPLSEVQRLLKVNRNRHATHLRVPIDAEVIGE